MSLAENGGHVPARTEDRQGLSKKKFWRMPLYMKIAINWEVNPINPRPEYLPPVSRNKNTLC
jgi:hypothetical protein